MSQDSQQSTVYELRRQQRGAEPPQKSGSWKRKLVLGTAVVLALAALGGAWWWRWSVTHVRMSNAQVWARVVRVSSEVDARVKDLLVHPGDVVKQGQTLMQLDDTELRAQLAAARAQADSKGCLLAQAKADLRVTQATVNANIARAKLDVAAAKAGVSNAEAQQNQSKAQLDKLLAGARPEAIEAAEARLATEKAMEDLDALEVTQSEQLVGEGIDSAHMLEVKKTTLITQKNAVREAELALALLKAGPTAEEKRIAQQQLAASEANLSLAQVQLQQAQAGLDRAEAMAVQVDLGQEQVNAAQADLVAAQKQVDAATDALDHMTIPSPVAGTIIRTFDKVGELCRKGVPTVLVSDDSEGRWIYGYVSERDAVRVQPGQKAWVEVVIGSGQDTTAKVEEVSLATNSLQRDDTTPTAGGAFAAAEQVLVKLQLMEQNSHWLPGNSARATITTR
jgi:HlyD family secretion protein